MIKNLAFYSFLLVLSICLFYLFHWQDVFALIKPENVTKPTAIQQLSPIKAPIEIWMVIYRIVGYVYTLFFLVAVFFIILAAYNFVLSQGDETKIKNAKAQVKWAIVAIVVALMSGGVSILIQNFLLEGSGHMRFFLF